MSQRRSARLKGTAESPSILHKIVIPARYRCESSNNSGSSAPQPPETAVGSSGWNTDAGSPEITPPPPELAKPDPKIVQKYVKAILGREYRKPQAKSSPDEDLSIISLNSDEEGIEISQLRLTHP